MLTARFTGLTLVADIVTKVPADPTTVTFTVKPPKGDSVNYATPNVNIQHPAVGVFVFTLPADMTQQGTYWISVEGDGNAADVSDEASIEVSRLHT